MLKTVSVPVAAVAMLATTAQAQDPAHRQVYFGEQHMHTQNSFDGFTVAPHQTWFDAGVPTASYVRVLEIPTPTWYTPVQ